MSNTKQGGWDNVGITGYELGSQKIGIYTSPCGAPQSKFRVDSNKTAPQLFLENYKKYGEKRVAMREKDCGIWKSYTWKECYDKVKLLFYGLMSLGFQIGDKVCIIGDNAPEYYWIELAVFSASGVVAPVYSDALPDELEYIASHSEARFAFAQDQEQIDKFLKIKDHLPHILKIIYWEPKGLQGYKDQVTVDFQTLIEQGKKYEMEHLGLFEQCAEGVKPDDLALLAYTSGTSTLPKAVMFSHQLLSTTGWSMNDVTPYQEVHKLVSFISPAWLVEQTLLLVYLQHAMTVYFCEKSDTVRDDLREVAPDFVFYTARLWEQQARMVQAKIADTSGLRRFLYRLSMRIGFAVVDCLREGSKPSLFQRVLYFFANLIMFRPIKDELGLIDCKWAESSGASISPQIAKFFAAIGLNFVDSYSVTEGIQLAVFPKMSEAGVIRRGVQLRFSKDSEILVKADTCFRSYYKDPEATHKALRDGWYHTGDAGFLDEKGRLVFLDRLSALTELTTGEKVAPQFIESKLKFSPYIKDAVIFASAKPFVSCLINIDFENVVKWAERKKVSFTTLVDLSQKEEVYELVDNEIKQLNKILPSKTRIKKFTILHKS